MLPPEINGFRVYQEVVDAVRYSYDCLEATAEFVYNSGKREELPASIPSSWLTRYLDRKWQGLNLSDKLGLMAYAWTQSDFWESKAQYQLFSELKRARDGLTHTQPFATEYNMKLLSEEREGRLVLRQYAVYQERDISRKRLEAKGLKSATLSEKKSIAQFSPTPASLDRFDAEKAVEIMLLHLERVCHLFFRGDGRHFRVYGHPIHVECSCADARELIGRRFDHIWHEQKAV